MRDFRDAKPMAHTLRASLTAMGLKITVSQSLELIAQAFGVADWNTLSAAINAEAAAVPGNASQSPVSPSSPPPPAAEDAGAYGDSSTLLSKQLESTLNQAFAYARGRNHEAITVEHLLLFLLDDPDASPVLKACGVDLNDLRKKLIGHVGNESKGHMGDGHGPKPTQIFQRVLQRAFFQVHSAGRQMVTGANEQGVTRADVINFIVRGVAKDTTAGRGLS